MKALLAAQTGLLVLCSIGNAQVADTVYTNGKIYTVNEEQPWAEAVAIKDGKFIAVGKNEDMKPRVCELTKVIDLDGKVAMPGLIDCTITC